MVHNYWWPGKYMAVFDLGQLANCMVLTVLFVFRF